MKTNKPAQDTVSEPAARITPVFPKARHPEPDIRQAPARRISVIDSHTGGEPTRVIMEGGPNLGDGPLTERRQRFADHFDGFRTAVVNEPRGFDALVGALLVEPTDPDCIAGTIFFNNVGYLGMCGHGVIGVIVTLAHQGIIEPGIHYVETPVGVVTAVLHTDGRVSVTNVPSYRLQKCVTVDVPNIGAVTGDIAWGGNWFFLTEDHGLPLTLNRVDDLTEFTWQVRRTVNAQGFPQVDHVELFGPPTALEANIKSFVLCPGKVYDRSPCGTGTSAKLACLADDGQLAEGEPWVQESITGSLFTATYQRQDRQIVSTITGTAYISSESILILDDKDPLCWGLNH